LIRITNGSGFYAALVGNWKKAVPMLRRSEDPTWSPLAALELEAGDSPAAQAELAERWQALADEFEGLVRERLQLRAGHDAAVAFR